MDIYLWKTAQTNPFPVWKAKGVDRQAALAHVAKHGEVMRSQGCYYQIFDPETGKEVS